MITREKHISNRNFCVVIALLITMCFQYIGGALVNYTSRNHTLSAEHAQDLDLNKTQNVELRIQLTHPKNSHLAELAEEEESEEKHKTFSLFQAFTISHIYWSSGLSAISWSSKQLKAFNLDSCSTSTALFLLNEVFRL